MAYTPQPGTLPHRAIEHLKKFPAGTELSTAVLADALDVEAATFTPCVLHARNHGALAARNLPGDKRRLYWSLGDGKPPAPPQEIAAFDAQVEGGPAKPQAPKAPIGRPPQPKVTRDYPFNAAAYIDGSLIVVGAEVREDGAVIFKPEQAMQLRRFIAWMPAQ